MQFIIAVVMLALAVYTNASGVQVLDVARPWSPVGAWGPALVNSGNPHGWGPVGHLGPLGVAVGSPWGAPLIGLNQGLVGGIPALGLGLGHGLPLAAPHGLGHEGKYVAANRGSVHVAPLTGHIQSVQSTNVEPAPGTIW